MTASNFDRCMAHVFRSEGGYVDHPDDPGGETNYGISKRSYPNENIRGMTKERAAMIYRRDFWDAVRGDALPAGIDLVAFDGAVNSGVSRGAKWVQAAVGAVQDGKIGSDTIAQITIRDVTQTINRACDKRMAFLQSLKTWPTFGRGWKARVASVRKEALAMAAAPVTKPQTKPVDVRVLVTPSPNSTQPLPKPGFWVALIAALSRLLGGR